MLIREVYKKGQIVIPKNIREMFGIKPKTKMVFEVEDDKIILRKVGSVIDDFQRIAESGPSISKIDVDKEYEKQIRDRIKGMGVNVH